MRNFKLLLETVNQQGGIFTMGIESFLPQPMEPGATEAELVVKPAKEKWVLDPQIGPAFPKIARDCQIFVFDSKGQEPQVVDLSMRAAVESNQKLIEAPSIDSPFQTFSIEMSTGPLSVPRESEKLSGSWIYTDCILVDEVRQANGKSDYWVIALSRSQPPGEEPAYFVSLDLARESSADSGTIGLIMHPQIGMAYMPNGVMLQLVQHFLERLNTEAAGGEKVNERIKVRSGGNKEIVKIKRIIHISPKQDRKAYALREKEPREIVWSHQWFSRGHWREIEATKLGKNRNGDYSEVGRTWVIESRKGNKDAPVVNKVRFMRGKNEKA